MARSILLVEDDALLLESLACLLEEEDYQVVCAADAETALEEASKRQFDLVVTDVRMPGMSGMGMLEHLRDSSPETRAVVITGFADFEAPVEAFRLQVDDFLTKPFDDVTFLSSIRRALEWMDRQAHWHRCLDQTYQDGLALLEWVLMDVAASNDERCQRARRQAALAARLASGLGLGQDRQEALRWGALLKGLAGPEPLARGMEIARSLLESNSSHRLGWESRSLAQLLKGALTSVKAETGLESAVLKAVSRYDALAHPDDVALGPSRAECLDVLRRGWTGPGEVLSKLESALTGTESPAAPDPGSRALLGLGLGYLSAGRFELALEPLTRLAEEAPTPVGLLGLARALAACGRAEDGLKYAQQAVTQSDSVLEGADARALVGTLKLIKGDDGAEQDLREAQDLYLEYGATRGEIRTLLLRAWAFALRENSSALEQAMEELVERTEESGLQWVLLRERWLSLKVFEAGATTSKQELALPWIARLSGTASPEEETVELQVEGLGPLRIRAHGEEVTSKSWKTSKARDIFLILLLHRNVEVPDERLTDLFWEELEGDRAQSNLYSALTYIRRAIRGKDKKGKDPVEHSRGRCRFNTGLSHRIDFLDFGETVVQALAERDKGNLAAARAGFERALQSYRGDLFENIEKSWVLPYRRRLRGLAIQACEALLEHYQAEGNRQRVLSLGEQLLAIDRCHQKAYQSLMLAWAEAGQPERAARLYWTCQRALEDELHMSPSAQTTKIYTQISQASQS